MSKWVALLCLAGFACGMFGRLDGLTDKSTTATWQWPVIGFVFFCGAMVLIGLVEKIALGLAKRLQKVGGKLGSPMGMQGARFFECAGWFVISLAVGLAVSGFWRGMDPLWMSLEAFGPGLGLLLGVKLRRVLFVGAKTD